MDEISRNSKGQAIVRSPTWPYARVATAEEERALAKRWRHTRRLNVKDHGPHEPEPYARVSDDGSNRCVTCGDYIVELKPVDPQPDATRERVGTAVAEVLSAYVEADFATDGVPDVGPALAALAEEFELDLDSMSMEAAGYVAVGKIGSKEVFLKETPDYEESPAPVYLGTTRVGYVEYEEGSRSDPGGGDNVVTMVARVGDFETGVQIASFEATVEPDTTNDAANRAAMAVAQEAGK